MSSNSQSKIKSKSIDTGVLALAVVGILVLVNIIGIFVFGRLDLTRDKEFTLSDATRSALTGLKDPITVRAYFTEDLPPPYSTNARYVKDLLDEYYAAADGNFRYEFIDPVSAETDEDKEKKKEVKQDIFGRQVREATSIERELQGMGVPPVQVHVNEDDKIEMKRAYMGLVITYGDKREVIPVVKDTGGLEYDMTTLIRKMTREKTPKIALLTGHDGLTPEKELAQLWTTLKELYDLTTIDLTQQKEIPADVDAILVIGPKTPFSDEEKKAIDRFIMSGKGAAFLLDGIRPNMMTLQVEELNHGLTDLLAAYGVQVQPGLVLDRDCATITVQQQTERGRVIQPVRYPFILQPRSLDPNHPLTRGLSQVALPFMGPVGLASPGENEGVKAEVLVKSSPRGWIQDPPHDLNPLQEWTMDKIKDEGAKGLVVSVRGALKSYSGEGTATDARVLVAGGSAFLNEEISRMLPGGNEALVLNLVDWLVLDEALLAVRTRGLAAAPLAEVSDGARGLVKQLNIFGLPFAFVALGLIRWRLREKRRRDVGL